MIKPSLRSSTLFSKLPAAGNTISAYYPAPSQLGAALSSSYDAYWGAIEAMLIDDEIVSDIELRKTAALSMPWKWSGTPTAIENTERLLANIDMDDLIMQSLKCVEWGFNPMEVDWVQENNIIMPSEIFSRTPSHFAISNTQELLYRGNAFAPVPVPKGKVIAVIRNASREKPYGVSLLEAAWAIWQVKWTHVAQLDRLGEKYAVPSTVAISKTATQQDQLDNISANLAAIESGASVALGGVDEIVQLSITGKATELVDVIRFYDNKLCKLITGQTLTTGNQQYGSKALGEVYERATLRISASDLKIVIKTLNFTLLKWLSEFNGNIDIAKMQFDEEVFKQMLDKSADTKPEPVALSHEPDASLLLCL
ncbi:phage portal protein family protein [Shewanella halifaxensis]|uniref:phage portal protein family protein n=1 Tax=Shewanella halifaxensis TaxID=271098 RepID=UPI0013A6431D|nr:DUF935 family protein [Shewanella halifaxensis]